MWVHVCVGVRVRESGCESERERESACEREGWVRFFATEVEHQFLNLGGDHRKEKAPILLKKLESQKEVGVAHQ